MVCFVYVCVVFILHISCPHLGMVLPEQRFDHFPSWPWWTLIKLLLYVWSCAHMHGLINHHSKNTRVTSHTCTRMLTQVRLEIQTRLIRATLHHLPLWFLPAQTWGMSLLSNTCLQRWKNRHNKLIHFFSTFTMHKVPCWGLYRHYFT